MDPIQPESSVIKNMFLNGGKTHFEFLKFIFTPVELQSEKPFVLTALLCSRLGLDKGDFNQKSFGQWLRRYRKNKKFKSDPVTPSLTGNSQNEETKSKFQFTDPSSLKKEQKAVLQFVK